MVNLHFQNVDQMIDFITNTNDFSSWETVVFRLSASNGMELNINTKINDNLLNSQYVMFKQLKSMLTNFYQQNSYLTMNMEIKLKFPDSLEIVMDPDKYYNALFVNFYSDSISCFSSISYLESSKNLDDGPIKSWGTYIMTLYTQWQIKNGLKK